MQRSSSKNLLSPLLREFDRRYSKIKNSNSRCFASFIPASTKRFAPVAVEAGCDSIVIQSTVTTARHNSKSLEGLILSKIVESINVPIIVGNTVTYNVSRELMETGIMEF